MRSAELMVGAKQRAHMDSTAAAWAGPYELQVAKNWSAEEAPADDDQEVWAHPAVVGHPALQYSSIVDIFGSSCGLQPYVVPARSSSSCSGGPQFLVEYNCYAAAAQNHDPTGNGTTTTPEDLSSSFEEQMERYIKSPEQLFQERKNVFENAYGAEFMQRKMHRYPPSIRALDGDRLYTVPRVVAIGPYHHYGGGHDLKQAEEVKHAAACHCITRSMCSVEEIYGAVISAANDSDARGLYHKDVMMAGLGDDDCFLPMMFFDACFLGMYIMKRSGAEVDPTLHDFFESSDDDIAHDIMLLENQIPLQVLHAVMSKCTSQALDTMKRFIARWQDDGFLQDRLVPAGSRPVEWDEDYYYNKAPHLLGLLRFYAVGKRSDRKQTVSSSDVEKMECILSSASAIELAEMGIFLKANETTELPDMGLARKWIIFKELSMAPLSLNDARASWLVNMAALELCTTPDFFDDDTAEFEDSAVCSYLLLLCMLMHREEDVHELRTKGILHGGAGLTNKNTLDFFTSLQSLRRGRCYALVMVEIARYRTNRPWIKLYAFYYKNRKTIAWAGSAFAGFLGIITTLIKLRGGSQ